MNTIRANDGGELLNSDQFYYTKDENGRNFLNVKNSPYTEKRVAVSDTLILAQKEVEPSSVSVDKPVVYDLGLNTVTLDSAPDFINFEEGSVYEVSGNFKNPETGDWERISEKCTAFIIEEGLLPTPFRYIESDFIGETAIAADKGEDSFFIVQDNATDDSTLEKYFYLFYCRGTFAAVRVFGDIIAYIEHLLDSKYLQSDVAMKTDIPLIGQTTHLWEDSEEEFPFYIIGQGYNSWGWEKDTTFSHLYKNTIEFDNQGKKYSVKDLVGNAVAVSYSIAGGKTDTISPDYFVFDGSIGVFIGDPLLLTDPNNSTKQYFCYFDFDTNNWIVYLKNVANASSGLATFGVKALSNFEFKVTSEDISLINSLIDVKEFNNSFNQEILSAGIIIDLIENILPAFTESDNGKVLGIVNGALAWVDKA